MSYETKLLEIRKKIDDLINFAKEKRIDLSEEIEREEKLYKEEAEKVYANLTDWDKVSIARNPERPYTLDYIQEITTDFLELHGDRVFGDDGAVIGGFCRIDNHKFMVIGIQKGRTVKEKVERNFGMSNPEGYRKALRLMKLAEKFHIPVLTLIDTSGAYPGLEAEERGQGEAIARNLMEMSGLKTPIIAVIIGEGGSGGALGLGVADKVFMLEYSVYSVISPEGCAAILFKDGKEAPKAAKNLKISAQNLKKLGVIDEIIEEPFGGAHKNLKCAAINLKKIVLSSIQELEKINIDTLLENRYNKFRRMGNFIEK